MSSQVSAAVPPSVEETLGVLYVGTTIAAVLFGITNLQAVIYYKRYPNDWWLYRYSVALLWVLDTLHAVLSTHAVYFHLIDMFGNLAGALVHAVWSFKAQLGIDVVIVLYVPGLYAIRLWKLGRHFHRIFPLFAFLAVAAALGAGIFMVYGISTTPNLSALSDIKTSIHTFCSTVVATDSVIAFMMCYYLHKTREAMNPSTTASRVLNLMRLVMVSGLATSTCSLLTLISYIAWPESFIFLGIVFIPPKLYINSLLAMFNHRSKHPSNKSNPGRGGHSTSAVLHFAPHTTAETEINIPPPEIQNIGSFDDKLDHSKGNSCLAV